MGRRRRTKDQSVKAAILETRRPTEPDVEETNASLTIRIQQQSLNIFRDTCKDYLDSAHRERLLQEVKGHLFKREWPAAFGKREYLQAYAARWSASRALAYANIFSDIQAYLLPDLEGHCEDTQNAREHSGCLVDDSLVDDGLVDDDRWKASSQHLGSFASLATLPLSAVQSLRHRIPGGGHYDKATGIAVPADSRSPNHESEQAHAYRSTARHLSAGAEALPQLRVSCLGGGAGAELVGLAGWLSSVRTQSEQRHTLPITLHVTSVDFADWAPIVQSLQQHVSTAPEISKYASANAKGANVALLSDTALSTTFHRLDLLDLREDICDTKLNNAHLATLMFTLNELYATSMSKTQRLLFQLTAALHPGSFLLVVDSPGSYSSVSINGAEKRYPMQWLLDHTLLQASNETGLGVSSGGTGGKQWEKVLTDESRWFRLPEELRYPIPLQDMRYQMHLYRRCEPDVAGRNA